MALIKTSLKSSIIPKYILVTKTKAKQRKEFYWIPLSFKKKNKDNNPSFFQKQRECLNKFREKGVNFSLHANSKYCVSIFLALSDNVVGRLKEHSWLRMWTGSGCEFLSTHCLERQEQVTNLFQCLSFPSCRIWQQSHFPVTMKCT